MKNYKYNMTLFITVFIWGSLYVSSKMVLSHIPAFWLLFFRFLISSIILIPITHKLKVPNLRREDYKLVFLVGFIGYFLSNAMLLLGIQFSNSSTASLINAMSPILVVMFAWLLLKEKLTLRKILAILISVIGAIIIIGRPSKGVSLIGIVFSIASVVLWSLVIILVKKLSAKYHPLTITAYGMLIAAVFSLPSGLIYNFFTGASINYSVPIILNVVYISIVCTALSHATWNFCLSKIDVSKCASFYPIQPMSSMLLGYFVLGESMNTGFLIGSAFIILSMFINA